MLLRAEKTPTGMKGIFVSLNGDDLYPYRVELDQQGKIVKKEKLRAIFGTQRIAPPPDPMQAGAACLGHSAKAVGRSSRHAARLQHEA